MAARYNDPEIKRQAIRLHDAGVGCWRAGRLLGISGTTVRWYVLHREAEPTSPELYRVDAQGERVSVAPGRITYACPHCGSRAPEAAGHPHCRAA